MTATPTARLQLTSTKPTEIAADALVVGVIPGRGKSVQVVGPGLTAAVSRRITDAITAVGATGKPGDVTRIPGSGITKARMVVGLGLGDPAKRDDESLRRSVGSAIRSLVGSKKVALALPLADDSDLLTIGVAALLAAYDFVAFRSSTASRPTAVANVTLCLASSPTSAQRDAMSQISAVATAVNLTRDLVNTPPNALPPAALASAARSAVSGLPVKVKVWDEKALAAEGCGGILAVGMGSEHPPRLVRMDYSPAKPVAHVAFVGKGITFDTGGISIKPAPNMDQMKGDMAGAGAVIGAVQAIAALGLPVRVTGWLASAENMPSGRAQRPGDVITMYGGKTVEVLNTDAEGRLVLADALGLAAKDKPDLIIDVATLTGAQRIALGARTAGVMANDDDARTFVCDAAGRAGEAMWPMPLPEDLRAPLDSGTADLANIGDPLGGMLTAGVFLQEFVPTGQKWVHIDIAGPSMNEKAPYGYTPKGATGSAVRAMVQVAAELAASGARM